MSVVDRDRVVPQGRVDGESSAGLPGQREVVDAGRVDSGLADRVALLAFFVTLVVLWLTGDVSSDGVSLRAALRVFGPACVVATICGASVTFVQSRRR